MQESPVADPARGHGINARSVVTLIFFFVINLLVLFPVRIRLPSIIGEWSERLRRAMIGEGPQERGVTEERNGNRHLNEGGAPTRTASSASSAPTVEPTDAGGSAQKDQADSHTTSQALDESPTETAQEGALTDRSGLGPKRKTYFTLGLATAPVIGVLILLASTCIPPSVVRRGIVGDGGVRPYDIMTLFLSFAYISLSLDCTGLLRYLAFTVATRSSSNGRLLFTYLYGLFVILALAVGNDPIVLSGTPFVAYFTSHARIVPPTAFLFAQFQSANLASALLVSSNPTNLVLTSSFHMSFLSFSAWTALPTVAAAAALYPTSLILFRRLIPDTISPPHVNPRSSLTDPTGAIFTTTIFISAIVLLVALSAAGKLEGVQGVWSVTAPAAILVFVRDCIHDYRSNRKGVQDRGGTSKASAITVDADMELSPIGQRSGDEEADERDKDQDRTTESGGRSTEVPEENEAKDRVAAVASGHGLKAGNASSTPGFPRRRTNSSVVVSRPLPDLRSGKTQSSATQPSSDPPASESQASTPSASSASPTHPITRLRHIFPTVSAIISRLPLPLLPFAFSMFILVEALDYNGWVSVWAHWWEKWARAGGAAGCIWLMGVISVIGCNILGTNIGVTVLLSRVLSVWAAQVNPSKRALYGSILALAVGSNFGAYSFSFPASLAGLLWRDILAQKGLRVRALEFVRWNVWPLAVTMIVGLLVVGAEACVMFKPGER